MKIIKPIEKNIVNSPMNILIIFLFVLLLLGLYGCSQICVPTYKGEKSDHFDGKRFIAHDKNKMGDFRELMAYQVTNKKEKWPTLTENEVIQSTVDQRVDNEIRYKLINHATLLIQHKNKNILTDPVFSKRASPFQILGPKRRRPPSIKMEDLPPIDIILLSHDHYDHLDIKSLKKLVEKHNPTIFVGLGLKGYLNKFNVGNVIEMDWGDEAQFEDLKFTFLYAKHWSNRGTSPFKTLWGSFMIESPEKTIYFAGDSGMDKHFQEIADQYPEIDLAFIPIGAYIPRSFMKYVHMPPEDAIIAHKTLNPKVSFAIHWGTFQLTGEGMYDPINELQIIMDKESIHNFIYDRNHDQYYLIK